MRHGEHQDTFFADTGPDSYSVRLDSFEGPLDLLLHLIRKNEVDIYNIPIATITRQYLEYLELLKDLNLDVAGDFLVMASTLIQIKSRMLLPVHPDDEAVEEEEDPRAELVRRLLEYHRYKEAARQLAERQLLGRDVFARSFPAPDLVPLQPAEEPVRGELFELIDAVRRVLARVPVETFHEVGVENISITDRITDILALLDGKEAVPFEDLLSEVLTREFIIASFLAVLELCRLKMIRLVQADRFATIWVTPAVPAAAGEAEAEE